MKRDVLDAAVSDVIRESFDWCCARCHKDHPDRKGRDFHASHFKSRSYSSTRYFPDNLTALCAACHDYFGKHPDEHTDFIRGLLGEVRYDMLRDRNRQVYRYRAADKKAMKEHYRSELKRLLDMRRNGVTGYIEVIAFD